MSCYMYIKEAEDLEMANQQRTIGEPLANWADLSPYERLLKENELLKLEIERLKGLK